MTVTPPEVTIGPLWNRPILICPRQAPSARVSELTATLPVPRRGLDSQVEATMPLFSQATRIVACGFSLGGCALPATLRA